MRINVQSYRKWLDRVNTTPEARRLVVNALNCYERIGQRKGVDLRELTPIVKAATSRFRAAWSAGTGLLTDLSTRHPAATDAIKRIAMSRSSEDRFHVVASINKEIPQSISTGLIKGALQDKSSRVRVKAAEAADRLHLRELISDLAAAVRAETNKRSRESMKFHLAMLEHGYLIEKKRGPTVHVTVRIVNGWTSREVARAIVDNPLSLRKHIDDVTKDALRIFQSRYSRFESCREKKH